MISFELHLKKWHEKKPETVVVSGRSVTDKGTVLLYWQINENMLYYCRGEKKCQGKPEKRLKQTYII